MDIKTTLENVIKSLDLPEKKEKKLKKCVDDAVKEPKKRGRKPIKYELFETFLEEEEYNSKSNEEKINILENYIQQRSEDAGTTKEINYVKKLLKEIKPKGKRGRPSKPKPDKPKGTRGRPKKVQPAPSKEPEETKEEVIVIKGSTKKPTPKFIPKEKKTKPIKSITKFKKEEPKKEEDEMPIQPLPPLISDLEKELSSMKIKDIREEYEKLNLPIKGTKEDLIKAVLNGMNIPEGVKWANKYPWIYEGLKTAHSCLKEGFQDDLSVSLKTSKKKLIQRQKQLNELKQAIKEKIKEGGADTRRELNSLSSAIENLEERIKKCRETFKMDFEKEVKAEEEKEEKRKKKFEEEEKYEEEKQKATKKAKELAEKLAKKKAEEELDKKLEEEERKQMGKEDIKISVPKPKEPPKADDRFKRKDKYSNMNNFEREVFLYNQTLPYLRERLAGNDKKIMKEIKSLDKLELIPRIFENEKEKFGVIVPEITNALKNPPYNALKVNQAFKQYMKDIMDTPKTEQKKVQPPKVEPPKADDPKADDLEVKAKELTNDLLEELRDTKNKEDEIMDKDPLLKKLYLEYFKRLDGVSRDERYKELEQAIYKKCSKITKSKNWECIEITYDINESFGYEKNLKRFEIILNERKEQLQDVKDFFEKNKAKYKGSNIPNKVKLEEIYEKLLQFFPNEDIMIVLRDFLKGKPAEEPADSREEPAEETAEDQSRLFDETHDIEEYIIEPLPTISKKIELKKINDKFNGIERQLEQEKKQKIQETRNKNEGKTERNDITKKYDKLMEDNSKQYVKALDAFDKRDLDSEVIKLLIDVFKNKVLNDKTISIMDNDMFKIVINGYSVDYSIMDIMDYLIGKYNELKGTDYKSRMIFDEDMGQELINFYRKNKKIKKGGEMTASIRQGRGNMTASISRGRGLQGGLLVRSDRIRGGFLPTDLSTLYDIPKRFL